MLDRHSRTLRMETNSTTENRPHNEDLAIYLDKLLRQDYRQPKQVPSRPSWEHSTDGLGLNRPEVSPPMENTAVEGTTTAPSTEPAEAKRPGETKAQTSKRPKRTPRPKRAKVKVKRKKREHPRNTRQTVMVVLIPALALTLVVLMRKPTSTPASTVPETTHNTEATFNVTDPEIEIDWEIPPLYKADTRDPMALISPEILSPESPAPRQTHTRRNLIVKGILYSEDRPAVIIGTRLLHTGDEISGARIIRIERGSVEFEADGETWKQMVASEDETLNSGIR